MMDDDELARRLAAATLSWFLGNKGIDYTKRSLVDGAKLGAYWPTLAKRVATDMLEEQNRLVSSQPSPDLQLIE